MPAARLSERAFDSAAGTMGRDKRNIAERVADKLRGAPRCPLCGEEGQERAYKLWFCPTIGCAVMRFNPAAQRWSGGTVAKPADLEEEYPK